MTPKQRVIEYFLYTTFVWGMFLIWLIPFQLYIVGLEWEQFVKWITYGTASEMVVSYPISKAILRGAPRITEWCKRY
jgi:hypothetical protein